MNWLISSANKILRLEDDVAMLAAIAKLAERIDSGEPLAGSDDFRTLFRLLAEGPSAGQESILDTIASPLLQATDIAEAFARYVRVVGSIIPPAEYRLLLCRLGAMDDPVCQGLDRRLQWRVVDRGPAASRQVFSDLKLDIGTQVRQVFDLTVDPELPPELAPVSGGHRFRVGMEGNLEGSVVGNVPIRLGAVAAGLSASGALRLDFYCLRHGQPLIAKALGQFLEHAPSPYQLHAVARELDARRLLGIQFQAAGSAQLTGAIRVGESLNVIRGLPAGIDGGAEGAIGFSVTDAGEYHLTVQSTDPVSGRGAPVRVQVQRKRSHTSNVGVGLRVGVDFTTLFQTLAPRLQKDLAGLDALFKQVQAMMPPSRVVEDILAEQVLEWFRDNGTRVLVDQLLGQSGSERLAGILGAQVGRLMDTFDGLWVDQVGSAAHDLAQRVVTDPASELDAVSRAAAIELLQPGLETVVTALHARLRENLVSTVGSDAAGGAFDRLSSDLNKIGKRVDDTSATANQRLDAMSRQLERALQGYQGTLTRLSEALVRTQEAKLGIQLRGDTRRHRGQELALRLDLDPEHDDASTLYQQVLTGSMEQAFEHARSGSGAVLAIEGELASFAGVQKHSRLEIAFLGIRLNGERLFNGDVAVSTDHNGNLAMHGRGESAAGLDVFGEKRTVGTINVFDLAVARQTRHMALGLTLSQRNERLDNDDVTRFFDSLAADGIDLLPDALGAEGVGRLQTLREQDADHVIGGELRVWMDLDETELLRLLAIRDVSAGLVGNPFDRQHVSFTAVDAMVDAMQASGGKPARELREMERLARDREHGLADDARDLLRKMVQRRMSLPGDISEFSSEGVRFRRMQRIAERAGGLADMIQTLREIYFSAEKVQSGAWDKDDFIKRQEEIDEILQFWFTAEVEDNVDIVGRLSRFFRSESKPEPVGLLNQKVWPYTLALLRTIKLLTASRVGSDDGAPLLASMTFHLDGTDKTVALV